MESAAAPSWLDHDQQQVHCIILRLESREDPSSVTVSSLDAVVRAMNAARGGHRPGAAAGADATRLLRMRIRGCLSLCVPLPSLGAAVRQCHDEEQQMATVAPKMAGTYSILPFGGLGWCSLGIEELPVAAGIDSQVTGLNAACCDAAGIRERAAGGDGGAAARRRSVATAAFVLPSSFSPQLHSSGPACLPDMLLLRCSQLVYFVRDGSTAA